MFSCVLFFDVGQFLEGCDEFLVEVIDCDFVVATVVHEILLASLDYLHKLCVLGLVI